MQQYDEILEFLDETARDLVSLQLITREDCKRIENTDRYVISLYEGVPIERIPPFHGPRQLERLRRNMIRFIELGIASGNPELREEIHGTDWRQVCDLVDLHDISLFDRWGMKDYKGYYGKHAEDSADMASIYLDGCGEPTAYVDSIRSGILSTHVTLPESMTHRVFCDLDIAGLFGPYSECREGCDDVNHEFGIDEGIGVKAMVDIYLQLFGRLGGQNGYRQYQIFTGLGQYFSEYYERLGNGGLYSNGEQFGVHP